MLKLDPAISELAAVLGSAVGGESMLPIAWGPVEIPLVPVADGPHRGLASSRLWNQRL